MVTTFNDNGIYGTPELVNTTTLDSISTGLLDKNTLLFLMAKLNVQILPVILKKDNLTNDKNFEYNDSEIEITGDYISTRYGYLANSPLEPKKEIISLAIKENIQIDSDESENGITVYQDQTQLEIKYLKTPVDTENCVFYLDVNQFDRVYILVNRKKFDEILGYLRLKRKNAFDNIFNVVAFEIFNPYNNYGYGIDLIVSAISYGITVNILTENVPGCSPFNDISRIINSISKFYKNSQSQHFLFDVNNPIDWKYSNNTRTLDPRAVSRSSKIKANDLKIKFPVTIFPAEKIDYNDTLTFQNLSINPISLETLNRYLNGKDVALDNISDLNYDSWTFNLPWDWSNIKKVSYGRIGEF